MKNITKKMSTVVLSFDKYSDIWPVFFKCFEKNWKVSSQTYLITNELRDSFTNVTTLCVGPEKSWSDRARKAIQKIDSEYILLMLEDYFVISPFENKECEKLLDFMEKNKADYLRIYPFPQIKFSNTDNSEIHKIPENLLYGVNLQPAIWKKDYLLKLLGNDDFSAWEFEARQKNGSNLRINGNIYTVDNKIFEMLNGVLQGKWYPPSVKKLKKIGITIDTSNRKVLSNRQVIIYKFKIIIRKIAGPKLIKQIKPLLKKIGIKFVTD